MRKKTLNYISEWECLLNHEMYLRRVEKPTLSHLMIIDVIEIYSD